VTRTLRWKVKSRLTQPDELAPAHPRVDREIDERAEPLTMRFRSSMACFQERKTISDLGLCVIERVALSLLLHGDLEHGAGTSGSGGGGVLSSTRSRLRSRPQPLLYFVRERPIR